MLLQMMASCSTCSPSFSTREPHPHMTAVAIGLVVGGATAAERQTMGLADGATRAAYNFQIAGDGERAVMKRPNGNWPIADFKRRYITGRGLARRDELRGVMGAVAEWFVL